MVEALNIAVGEECTVGRGDRVVPEINVVPNGSKCTDYHTRAQVLDDDRSFSRWFFPHLFETSHI